MRRFRFFRNPLASDVGYNLEEFLRWLEAPGCIFLEGEDATRTRAFVTLLHGNEPSGAKALLRWLKSGQQPCVNIVCILPSVAAALQEPLLSHRMLPRARDLNRCFAPPFDDAQGALAEEVLEILHMHQPEAVVDMHNTSGSGPSFAVCTFDDRKHDALVSLFTQRLIISNLRMGALMDISEHHYPTVTIEVGGRLDDSAHELAWEGLCRYFCTSDLFHPPETDWSLERLYNPIRLELLDNVTLTYDERPCASYDITLRSDIENLNFGTVRHDTVLGWTGAAEHNLFSARDMAGRCAVSKLVRIDDGKLYPATDLRLFMITTNAAIAQSDCLFYAVAEYESSMSA